MPLLSARHITLGYTHQGSLTTILQDFSLDVAEGELIGMLSIGDLVKQTIDDQASLIQQLEQYIRGG